MGTFTGQIDRALAAKHGQEAVAVGERGFYITASGRRVDLKPLLDHAVKDTRSYPPNTHLGNTRSGPHETTIEVTNETTLSAASRQIAMGYRPVALNFASATSPGGGFLTGARAQEEYLARSSCLYECIRGNPMYEFHRNHYSPLYSDYVIYSPDVPVFRDDEGTLLEKPYLCSFITCPAVNAKVVLERDPTRGPEIRSAMWERMLKVLAIAAFDGHETLILGAWGCGVFGNDPGEIAEMFNRALAGQYRGAFARVVFAVVDRSEERRFIGPFCEEFGVSAP